MADSAAASAAPAAANADANGASAESDSAAAPAASTSAAGTSSKSSKNARKKANKKAKAKAASALTSALLAQCNALTHSTVFHTWLPAFHRKGAFRFYYLSADDLSDPLLEWAFTLTKINMQRMYQRAQGWGWSDKDKRAEAKHKDARYIIVTQIDEEEQKQAEDAAAAAKATPAEASAVSASAAASDSAAAAAVSSAPTFVGSPVAFCSFRYVLGDADSAPVLYVYELQLESCLQRKGLGKFLMSIVELLAWRCQLMRVVLTVFLSNQPALKLYRDTLHYEMDESDPSLYEGMEDEKHTILCKKSKKITEISQIQLPIVPQPQAAPAVAATVAAAAT